MRRVTNVAERLAAILSGTGVPDLRSRMITGMDVVSANRRSCRGVGDAGENRAVRQTQRHRDPRDSRGARIEAAGRAGNYRPAIAARRVGAAVGDERDAGGAREGAFAVAGGACGAGGESGAGGCVNAPRNVEHADESDGEADPTRLHEVGRRNYREWRVRLRRSLAEPIGTRPNSTLVDAKWTLCQLKADIT